MMRVGFGYDVHRLVPDRPLILGGVVIPSEMGLAGHSDADVLLHAIADALLGAAALGDIGLHFPDTDVRWKDADSLELLEAVGGMIASEGYKVVNVDSTVVLEKPKLRPYIDAMCRKIAGALAIASDSVSVKATTSEQVGFAGRGEGAVAHAVCLIERR